MRIMANEARIMAEIIPPRLYIDFIKTARWHFCVPLRGETLSTDDPQQLERVARYIARPALAMDSVRRREDGSLESQTPPDPRTGATVRIFDATRMDPYRHGAIPDHGRHQIRYYGAFSNRARSALGLRQGKGRQGAQAQEAADEESEFVTTRRASSRPLAAQDLRGRPTSL